MPKNIENAIIKEYISKGYSYNRAKQIAIATMVKKGIWRRK